MLEQRCFYKESLDKESTRKNEKNNVKELIMLKTKNSQGTFQVHENKTKTTKNCKMYPESTSKTKKETKCKTFEVDRRSFNRKSFDELCSYFDSM